MAAVPPVEARSRSGCTVAAPERRGGRAVRLDHLVARLVGQGPQQLDGDLVVVEVLGRSQHVGHGRGRPNEAHGDRSVRVEGGRLGLAVGRGELTRPAPRGRGGHHEGHPVDRALQRERGHRLAREPIGRARRRLRGVPLAVGGLGLGGLHRARLHRGQRGQVFLQVELEQHRVVVLHVAGAGRLDPEQALQALPQAVLVLALHHGELGGGEGAAGDHHLGAVVGGHRPRAVVVARRALAVPPQLVDHLALGVPVAHQHQPDPQGHERARQHQRAGPQAALEATHHVPPRRQAPACHGSRVYCTAPTCGGHRSGR